MGEEWYIQSFGGENLRKRDHLEDLGIDGSKWDGGRDIDWTDLAQDRDRWQALVNVVINIQVP